MSAAAALQAQPRRKTLGVRRNRSSVFPPSNANGTAAANGTSAAPHATPSPSSSVKRVGLSKRAPPSPAASTMQQQRLLAHQQLPACPARSANGGLHSAAEPPSTAALPPTTAADALAAITSSLDSFTEATQHSSQRSQPASDKHSTDGGQQHTAAHGSNGTQRHKRLRDSSGEDGHADDDSTEHSQHGGAASGPAKRQKEEPPASRGPGRPRQMRSLDKGADGQVEVKAEKAEAVAVAVAAKQQAGSADTHSGDSPMKRGPGQPRKAPLSSSSDSTSVPGATAEELDRVAEINAALAHISTSPKRISQQEMRRMLKVNAHLPAPLLAEYRKMGEVSVEAWRAIKRLLSNKRSKPTRRPTAKQHDDDDNDDDDEKDDSSKPAARWSSSIDKKTLHAEEDKDWETDASEERQLDDIIDDMQGEGQRMKEEKTERKEEATQPVTPTSQRGSNGHGVVGLDTARRSGSTTAAGRLQQPTAEDVVKLDEVNDELVKWKRSGAKLGKDALRERLRVGRQLMNPLLAAFDSTGERLTMAQWMDVKRQVSIKSKQDKDRMRKEIADIASSYQRSSSVTPIRLDQRDLDALIASSQADSIDGSQDSATSARASRIPTGEPQQDELDKVALINKVMAELLSSGEQLRQDELRRRLHVGNRYADPLVALYRKKGEVTLEDWRSVRRQLSEQRVVDLRRERQEAAVIAQFKQAAAQTPRPSREERVELRRREEEAKIEAARLKKQRANEQAQRKAEAEAERRAREEAALAQQRAREQADEDGLATESDSDREEQERLEDERRRKLQTLEEKRRKLEQNEDDEEDDGAWSSYKSLKRKKPLSSAKAEKAAVTAAATALRKEHDLQQKVKEVNEVMSGWYSGGQHWSRDELRKRLKVGGDFPTMIVAEWNAKGVLSVESWRAMRKKVSGVRQKKRREAVSSDVHAAVKPKSSPHGTDGVNGTSHDPAFGSSASSTTSHTPHHSATHTSATHKKKLKRTDSDNDLSFHHSESHTQPLVHRSLRRRTKVDYTAQLEEDPHTIVELTWYPTKADQPFRIVIDPLVPAIMDVHAHLADVEIIGVLAGQWLAERRVLWVQSAYPCRQVGTDDDLTNVEIDPASLISVQETAEGRGMRLVGWYHSHPYFRNQPSLVDVENQSRYQTMFGQAGSSSSGGKHGMPFIGAIITPYGKGDFKPLPSSVKWFYNRERRGHAAAADMPDEPMEMWTDIAEQLDDDDDEKQAAGGVEGYAEVLERLCTLCAEYGGVHGRVDFFEAWQAGQDDHSKRLNGSGGSDSGDGLSSSQLSPSEVRRATSSAMAADVRNKLDQFRQSLTAHLALLGRWKEASKRRMVDELIRAVSAWKGSGGQTTKQRRRQQLKDDEGGGDDTDTEGSGENDQDDASGREEEEEEEEEADEEESREKQHDSSDEIIADSQVSR